MRSILTVVGGASIVLSACGAGPPSVETAPDGDPAQILRLAAASAAEHDTLRYRIAIDGVVDPDVFGIEELAFVAEGEVDLARDATRLRIEYGPSLIELLALDVDDPPRYAEQIHIGDESYVRGLTTFVFVEEDVDFDAWYASTDPGFDVDVVAGLVRGDELGALLEAAQAVTILGTEQIDGTTTRHVAASVDRPTLAELAAAHPGSIVDLELTEGGPDVDIEVWLDADELPRRLRLAATDPSPDILSYVIVIDLFDFGSDVDIAPPPNPLPAPSLLPPTNTEPRTTDLSGIRPQDDGSMFRVNLWRLDGELQLSVEHDGRVVAVSDRSVQASTSDFTTWRLSETGVDRLVAEIEESGLLAHPLANRQFGDSTGGLFNSGAIFYNDCCVLQMDGLGRRDGFTEEEFARRLAFEELVERLTEHEWLGADVLTDPEPFVPEGLTVQAERSRRSVVDPIPWPLEEGIEELGIETTTVTGTGYHLCLYGDDVPEVFALLDVSLWAPTVDDGTAWWDLTIRPHVPGYRLYGDPCEER